MSTSSEPAATSSSRPRPHEAPGRPLIRADPIPFLVCGVLAWVAACAAGVAAVLAAADTDTNRFYTSPTVDLDQARGPFLLVLVLLLVATAFVGAGLLIVAGATFLGLSTPGDARALS